MTHEESGDDWRAHVGEPNEHNAIDLVRAGEPGRGRVGAGIGFMVWLWISAVIVLLGGEVNAEMEHQTARDTTEGKPKPLGSRGATMADHVGKAQL